VKFDEILGSLMMADGEERREVKRFLNGVANVW